MTISAAPLLIDDSIILHSPGSLSARSVETGQPLWHLNLQLPAPSAGSSSGEETAEAGRVVERHAQSGMLLNCATSDGRHVFFVDTVTSHPGMPDANNERHETQGEHHSPLQTTNRLYAVRIPDVLASGECRLTQPGSSAVEITWAIGGPDGHPGLRDSYFLGPPVCADGVLFCLMESHAEVSLLGLEPDSGQLIFQQRLTILDSPIRETPKRAGIAYLPAIAGDCLYCVTPAGAVVCWNRVTRSLQWISQYSDRTASPRPHWSSHRGEQGAIGTVQPVVCRERVVILPPDSRSIHVLNAATGIPVWQDERGSVRQVLATPPDRLICIGRREVSHRHLETGDLIWTRQEKSNCGEGLLVEGRVVIPLDSGRIAAIDIMTGTAEQSARRRLADFGSRRVRRQVLDTVNKQTEHFARTKQRNDSEQSCRRLIANNDWMVFVNGGELKAFYQAEHLQSQVIAEANRRPGDLANLIESGSLHIHCNGDEQDCRISSLLQSASDDELALLLAELLVTHERESLACDALALITRPFAIPGSLAVQDDCRAG